MSSSAPSWVTKHLCPAIGVALNNLMWYMPYQNMKQAMAKDDLGVTNTLPFLVMVFNCTGWATYGIQTKDYYIFCSSVLGIIAGLYYTLLSVIILTSNKSKDRALQHVYAIVSTAGFWCAIAIIAGIILTRSPSDGDKATLLIGIISDVSTISYYAAPLSTVVKVVRTHDSSSLNLPTIVLNTVNNLMWFVYGIVAVGSILVWLPGACGLALGGIEIFVVFTFKVKVVVVAISQRISDRISRKYRNANNANDSDNQIYVHDDHIQAIAALEESSGKEENKNNDEQESKDFAETGEESSRKYGIDSRHLNSHVEDKV